VEYPKVPSAHWVPVYLGKRRGKCSTRAYKTHNRKALAAERRYGKTWPEIMRTAEICRIGGLAFL
jgi:hypothetical protein